MYKDGYIKFYRTILDWEWYDDMVTSRLFIHLLLTVNIADDIWHGIYVPKGSRVSSLDELASETGLTKKQVRNSLDKLEKAQCMARSKHGKIVVYAMLNWDKYQTKGHNPGHKKGTMRARSGHDEGTRIRNKEYKEYKEEGGATSGAIAPSSTAPQEKSIYERMRE